MRPARARTRARQRSSPSPIPTPSFPHHTHPETNLRGQSHSRSLSRLLALLISCSLPVLSQCPIHTCPFYLTIQSGISGGTERGGGNGMEDCELGGALAPARWRCYPIS